MLDIGTLLRWYKKPEVQEAMIKSAENKEIAVVYGEKGYGKRPDVLIYPKDILSFVQKGCTSFHCSEENWSNPLQLTSESSKNYLDELRIGWDLVLDIDCKFFEYSKIAAQVLSSAMDHFDAPHTIKFSGNNGFHIAVPFEAFPETVHDTPTTVLFPDGPRKIASFLTAMIKSVLSDKILEFENIDQITKRTGKLHEELVNNNEFNPFAIMGIDTILISPRHLFRMPYSFHEKSNLVSMPIKKNKIAEFEKSHANPETAIPTELFLNRNVEKNSAKKLFIHAFDFEVKQEEEKPQNKVYKEFEGSELAIPEQYFPPCIKLILQGLKDGRKRALFALLNFFSSVGWSYDEIEKAILEWNKKNPEPLREVYVKGQLRFFKAKNKKILPPNCINRSYYIDIGVCKPDSFCQKIKNPANYAIIKQKIASEEKNNSE